MATHTSGLNVNDSQMLRNMSFNTGCQSEVNWCSHFRLAETDKEKKEQDFLFFLHGWHKQQRQRLQHTPQPALPKRGKTGASSHSRPGKRLQLSDRDKRNPPGPVLKIVDKGDWRYCLLQDVCVCGQKHEDRENSTGFLYFELLYEI